MPLAWRSNSRTPISVSNCWIASVSEDWETNTARAPAEIDPVSATAMKWRIWRNVIIPIAFQAAALLSAFYYVAHP